MNKEVQAILQLEDQFEEDKQKIEQQMQIVEEHVHSFRQETDELFEAIRYYTRENDFDLEPVHWQMMDLNDNVYQEGKRCYEFLDDKQVELKRELNKKIDQIEEEAWQKRRAQAAKEQ